MYGLIDEVREGGSALVVRGEPGIGKSSLLTAASARAVPFRVSLDGEPPGSSHGTDLDEARNGVASDPRLYQLIRQSGRVEERTFEITFLRLDVRLEES